MHIAAPNYTQTPNVCFDEIFKTLKEGELRVILVLIRQTFGWHKEYDQISIGQISKKSGMEKRSVIRSLATLIEKGLVIKKKFGNPGFERCHYSLVVETPIEDDIDDIDDDICEEERELILKSLYQCPKDSTPQCPKDSTPSVPKTHTKETNTKETIQNKQQQAAPVSAAVSSKSSKKEKPKINPVLDRLDLTLDEKIWMTSKFNEETLKNGVEFTLENKDKIKTTVIQYLTMACQKGLSVNPVKKPKLSVYEEICKYFKHYENYNFATCFLNPTSIAFQRGMKNEKLEINSFFSWSKLEELCNIFGIKFSRKLA